MEFQIGEGFVFEKVERVFQNEYLMFGCEPGLGISYAFESVLFTGSGIEVGSAVRIELGLYNGSVV